MKIKNFIVVLGCLLLVSQISFAQLYLDNEGNVGVGVQQSSSARMHILNATEGVGLRIYNHSDASTKIGIDIDLDKKGKGHKHGIFSSVEQNPEANGFETLAFKAFVTPAGDGPSYGFYSEVKDEGIGIKYGFFGRIEQPNNAIGNAFGAYNQVTQNGSGDYTYGIYNNVSQKGSGSFTYGIQNYINFEGTGQAFGVNNYLLANNGNSSSATAYGSYNYVQGSTDRPKVGMYARAVGPNSKAAYFEGDVVITGATLQASDATLKQDIQTIDNALSIIDQISPKKYFFKDLKQYQFDYKEQQYGFLAQDLSVVLPELVKTVTHEGRRVPVVSADGRIIENVRLEEDEEIMTVNYTALIPILTQAIKEQQTLIQALTNRIEELENN